MDIKTREEAIACCMQLADVYEDYPFRDQNWTVMRHTKNKKAFAWIFARQGAIWINVKCSPGWIEFWRQTYASIIPAYHLNKEHWNSIILDGTVPETDIRELIAESYRLTAPVIKRKNIYSE